jgi:hypothetical protein
MSEKQEMSQEQIITMVKAIVEEMRRPSPEEAKKKADEEAERLKRRDEMIRLANEEIAARKREQDACPHQRPNGSRCLGGQVHRDRVVLICMRCQKVIINRMATPDDHQHGPVELLIENQPRIGQVM